MALLKNSTIEGSMSSNSTSTTSYGFSSGSFTHQKQPIMPNDQKAKLLAMHRDGKANAGIYVAVVLLVYFILVTILLCRYSKRRRAPEPLATLESSAEQGRLRFLNLNLGKLSCGGEGCPNLACFSKCQRVDTDRIKSAAHVLDECEKEEKNIPIPLRNSMDDRFRKPNVTEVTDLRSRISIKGDETSAPDQLTTNSDPNLENRTDAIVDNDGQQRTTDEIDNDNYENEDSMEEE